MFLVMSLMAFLVACGGSDDGATPAGSSGFVTIGTGAVTGVYYPAGGALAKLINDRRDELGLRASVESTGGSVYNINAVLSGELTVGIAQSDRQYQAVQGLREWQDQPQADLRAICSLHGELITLLAAVDAEIHSVADLAGKRVNMGNPGSGQRANSEDVLRAFGLDTSADVSAEGLVAAEAPQVLQDGRLDAFFYTVGHPNGNITQATSGRRTVRFIPIAGEAIDALVAERPYYAHGDIDVSLYPQADNQEAVPTFGVTATVVTSAAVDEDVIYAFTSTIFDNLELLREMHPALRGLDPVQMVEGLSAPLHPGAERALREQGLIE
ncbi:MAG: TAXI family TRAP transporter solute-binding subunit [Planctomycetota bacterium]|nr:MAG: TAXI family TRAP transporter solute-binding subunit [Planctomycetota bacterium]